ncbi:MAG TPA: fused MFS/spermidine synthase [Phycisphaerales bacterium]|nr:fused MFS/spermidine synthase [Phycisphaerales bacterium]
MLLIYSAAIFLSAGLLFLVQPMAAKQVLPLLGGTPAVWTTSMLFFQAALLSGYGYSHLLSKVSVRIQPVIHLLLLALCIYFTLPIGLPNPVPMPPQAQGSGAEFELAFYMIKLLAISVGMPFFVLATTGPLLQRWFSRTGHAQSADPYFLYAASNAGSFIGLLSYPFAIEPFIGLREQESYWSWSFGIFGILALACSAILWSRLGKAASVQHPVAAESSITAEPLTLQRRLYWILLSAVPSSLLLGVTQHISTDVAAMPLLWVIPLALYLLTFVIVFAKKQFVSARFLGIMTVVGAAGVCLVTGMYLRKPIIPLVALHVATFFIATWMCHKRLADDRPRPEHLTEYFLLMSVGGVIGGLFNALLSPAIFSEILEYPIAIVAACLLRPRAARPAAGAPAPSTPRRLIIPAVVIILVVASVLAGIMIQKQSTAAGQADTTGMAFRVFIPLAICLLASPKIIAFALSLTIIFGVAKLVPDYATERFLFQERSFYGVHRVKENLDGKTRVLMHGTTWHGLQNRDIPGENTRWEKVPTSYFHPAGPLGQMFTSLAADNPDRIKRVGILGLGVGSIAAYALPGARFTFYEIDDVVIRVAKNPELFTFLSNAGERVDTKLGDGRLVIATEPVDEFNVIIFDAFSSDSVPAHLITKEAFEIYLTKLKADGIMATNITNNHVDLRQVLARAAAELGLVAIIQDDKTIDERTKTQGRLPSTWVLMAREAKHLRPMIDDLAHWKRLESTPADPLWTDSYSSLVRVLKLPK